MAIQVAEQSAYGFASETKYRYDVFLSFRGEDTRHSFTVILYDALRRKGINAFIDDKKLGKGERISPALLKAIEKSRISIIVFSRNYANSTWCLEELAHIIRCKKEKNQLVMPIFYKVDPMDVQYQRNNFGEAMSALEDRFRNDMEKVQKWKSALYEAASLSSAWLFEDGYESGFIESIVEAAYAMLPPKRLHSPDYKVGLEPRVKKVKSLLNQSEHGVCMLGIHGTGGIGKTTLAKALYNSMFLQFEGACFLFDVKEASMKYQGIVRFQETLLSEILEEKKMSFGSVDEGISKIKHRLSRKRVLLVLDDVDDVEQLEQLAGGCDWFGSGSKVIITTRNKQLLLACNVEKTYEMKELSKHDSLELFCWHAFHLSQPPKGYRDMSKHVIIHAQGLPLALRVIGSNLVNKNLEEWRSILEQYDLIPPKTIHDVLKISYDCLPESAQHIFLDIACFFKNEKCIKEILEAYDLGACFYCEVLVEKSLITVDGDGCLGMHDLIQKMGREIVRQEAPSNPGKRSRLWNHNDVLTVLHENLGSSNIEGIMFDLPQKEEVKWSGIAFENMNNLRILIVRNAQFSTGPNYFPNSLRWLDWEEYPSTTLPSGFSPKKLVFLKLCCSPFRLEEPLKRFEYVTYMDLSDCECITEVPDMSQFQNLRRLLFEGCSNLIKVHDSVGSLSKLVELNVSLCTKLTNFPHEIKMPSLQGLYLSHCKNLDYFPHIVGNMDALRFIYASDTAIKEFPPSVGNLRRLQSLDITSCKSLRELPNNLFMFRNLGVLVLGDTQPGCGKSLKKLLQGDQPLISFTNLTMLNLENCCLLDEDLHLILQFFRNLNDLNLAGNDFVSLPECIKECAKLSRLEVNNCKRLRHIPELPKYLTDIAAENCTSLTPESLGRLWSQAKKVTRAPGTPVTTMPATTFPDWFNICCKGGTLSFHVRGKFPFVVFALELGEANPSVRHDSQFSISINGRKIELEQDFDFEVRPGHVSIFGLSMAYEEEEWKKLDKFLELDWNDVELQVICLTPDIPIVRCGVFLNPDYTNMDNVQFKSPMLSINASTTLLKRRAMASSPTSEPPKKVLRMFKAAADNGKLNNTNKRTRRMKRHQIFHLGHKRKMVFPMGKHVWRFLYY